MKKETKFERALRVRESENGRKFKEHVIPNKKKIFKWTVFGLGNELNKEN